MLNVNDKIRIPLDEFQLDYVRAGGPGGQNVNKVASKAVLRWNPAASPNLPGPVKARLLTRLASRLTKDGDLILTSQRTRDRERNREDCLERLKAMVLTAAHPPKSRVRTRPTRASQERRSADKTQRAARKRDRRPPTLD